MSVTQALFYLELLQLGEVLVATRLALSTNILMICLVAGRIVPAFTGNQLKSNSPGRLPISFSRFDAAVIILSLIALLGWARQARATFEMAKPLGALMVAAGMAHLTREARWCSGRTLRKPLLWILHLGYLFVPMGFLLTGMALLLDDPSLSTVGIHAWAAGAIDTMTLAVMTRATRGHTGQTLQPPWTTTWIIYIPILLSALLRLAAALVPVWAPPLWQLSGIFWLAAFTGYAALYLPLLLRQKRLRGEHRMSTELKRKKAPRPLW